MARAVVGECEFHDRDADPQGAAEYRDLLSRIQAGKARRRVVFLGLASAEKWESAFGQGDARLETTNPRAER